MKIGFPATVELKISNEPERFKIDFNTCENPDCDCNGIIMVLYNEEKRVEFFLDFSSESYRENNYSEEETPIINALIGFLKAKESGALNIEFFKRHYKYVKNCVRNKRDVIDSFKMGTFLPYHVILWEDNDLRMNIDGKDYLILDSYCVTPDCPCKEASLDFVEEVYKLGERSSDFAFAYNYFTGVYRDPVGISKLGVENIVKLIPESLKNKLKNRHAKLKKEMEVNIQKRIAAGEFVRREIGKRKLGRNEPCHCGSGRKYKKCCLEKDIEKYGKGIKAGY